MTTSESRQIGIDDPGYPVGLFDLEDPPPIYIMGELADRPMVAVVGTRKCTRYGIELAESCGRILAELDWPVVSGLARGIDAAAHRGMVSRGGRGVAVLGSGLHHIYPKENEGLLGKVLECGGAVVSEYADGTPPDRWRFPAGNRICPYLAGSVPKLSWRSSMLASSNRSALFGCSANRPLPPEGPSSLLGEFPNLSGRAGMVPGDN